MNRPGRAEYDRILSAGCTVAAMLAVVTVLWFIQAHYFNATNAGWGDQEQDRHQWLLGWGIRISAIVALACVVITATRSRRALISITAGAALSGLIVLVAQWLPIVGMILAFPGLVVALYIFGVHADGGEFTAYIVIVNACAYSGIVSLLLRKRTAR